MPYHDLPLTEILNNCNGLDYFLSKFSIIFSSKNSIIKWFEFVEFLQTIDAVGYANFYLNAEVYQINLFLIEIIFVFFVQAFRCAGLSVQQQPHANMTNEQLQGNLEILRNMANDLIEQYFLPTVRQSLDFF